MTFDLEVENVEEGRNFAYFDYTALKLQRQQ